MTTGAKAGDYISLDFFQDVRDMRPWSAVELVCAADNSSERILETCTLETSLDGAEWVSVGGDMRVTHHALAYLSRQQFSARCESERVAVSDASPGDAPDLLRALSEWVFRIPYEDGDATPIHGQRCFRIRSTADHSAAWKIHKLYLRGLLRDPVLAK